MEKLGKKKMQLQHNLISTQALLSFGFSLSSALLYSLYVHQSSSSSSSNVIVPFLSFFYPCHFWTVYVLCFLTSCQSFSSFSSLGLYCSCTKSQMCTLSWILFNWRGQTQFLHLAVQRFNWALIGRHEEISVTTAIFKYFWVSFVFGIVTQALICYSGIHLSIIVSTRYQNLSLRHTNNGFTIYYF